MYNFYRLTLTWDVLKLTFHNTLRLKTVRLTLTWDVLKSGIKIPTIITKAD